MSLDKGALKAGIIAALTSAEPGEDSVDTIASIFANAIDAFVKSGTVKVDTIGGSCNYAGAHPPLHSEGKVE